MLHSIRGHKPKKRIQIMTKKEDIGTPVLMLVCVNRVLMLVCVNRHTYMHADMQNCSARCTVCLATPRHAAHTCMHTRARTRVLAVRFFWAQARSRVQGSGSTSPSQSSSSPPSSTPLVRITIAAPAQSPYQVMACFAHEACATSCIILVVGKPLITHSTHHATYIDRRHYLTK